MKLHSKLNSKIFILAILALITAGIISGYNSIDKDSDAFASISDFNPGNIIDDSIFYNKGSMTESEIQSFLDNLIPSCNTWNTSTFRDAGGNLVGSPYVCINNYHENPDTGETSFEKGGGSFPGGHSAAKIIYDASQKYNINPQVLLVLIKKESLGPLTSDNWPTKWQYRYALGYGCPDSGPGYTADCNEKQAGFYKQVNLAAWQLDYYRKNPNSYRYKLGANEIQYSPDPACGAKTVNIENIATLSLYIYTPYTPNDAALANYPGTANCGAYGNRNFFMFFREWFGSTTSSKKVSGETNAVYQIYSNQQKRHILTGSELEANIYLANGWSLVRTSFVSSDTGYTVHRLYSKPNNSFYYTTSDNEKKDLINHGWIYDGSSFIVSNTGMPVYKLFSSIMKTYYFTNNIPELVEYIAAGWKNYGVAFYEQSNKTDGIYRLYSNETKSYFLTADISELLDCIENGWIYEGLLMNDNPLGDSVHHLYSPLSRQHYYTTNESEKSTLIKSGWLNGGVVFRSSNNGNEIYRFYNSKSGVNYFSKDSTDINKLQGEGWSNLGIVFFSNGEIAVHRIYNPINNHHSYINNRSLLMDLLNRGWIDHGVSFYAQSYPSQKSKTPAYQMCDLDTSRFILAFTQTQIEEYQKKGLSKCWIEFYASDSGRKITSFQSPYTGWSLLSSTSFDNQDFTNNGWIEDYSFHVR